MNRTNPALRPSDEGDNPSLSPRPTLEKSGLRLDERLIFALGIAGDFNDHARMGELGGGRYSAWAPAQFYRGPGRASIVAANDAPTARFLRSQSYPEARSLLRALSSEPLRDLLVSNYPQYFVARGDGQGREGNYVEQQDSAELYENPLFSVASTLLKPGDVTPNEEFAFRVSTPGGGPNVLRYDPAHFIDGLLWAEESLAKLAKEHPEVQAIYSDIANFRLSEFHSEIIALIKARIHPDYVPLFNRDREDLIYCDSSCLDDPYSYDFELAWPLDDEEEGFSQAESTFVDPAKSGCIDFSKWDPPHWIAKGGKEQFESGYKTFLDELLEIARKYPEELTIAQKALSELEYLALNAFRFSSKADSSCLPEISDSPVMAVVGGKNPAMLHDHDLTQDNIIPNSVRLSSDSPILFLLGANGAGKSQIAEMLCNLSVEGSRGVVSDCSQHICPELDGIVHTINISIHSHAASSFMNEMGVLAEELKGLDALAQGSLVLLSLDEPGRGTDAQDGEALLAAISKYIVDRGHFAVIPTHFNKISNNRKLLSELGVNAQFATIDLESHKLVEVAEGDIVRSGSVKLADKLELDPEFLANAKAIEAQLTESRSSLSFSPVPKNLAVRPSFNASFYCKTAIELEFFREEGLRRGAPTFGLSGATYVYGNFAAHSQDSRLRSSPFEFSSLGDERSREIIAELLRELSPEQRAQRVASIDAIVSAIKSPDLGNNRDIRRVDSVLELLATKEGRFSRLFCVDTWDTDFDEMGRQRPKERSVRVSRLSLEERRAQREKVEASPEFYEQQNFHRICDLKLEPQLDPRLDEDTLYGFFEHGGRSWQDIEFYLGEVLELEDALETSKLPSGDERLAYALELLGSDDISDLLGAARQYREQLDQGASPDQNKESWRKWRNLCAEKREYLSALHRAISIISFYQTSATIVHELNWAKVENSKEPGIVEIEGGFNLHLAEELNDPQAVVKINFSLPPQVDSTVINGTNGAAKTQNITSIGTILLYAKQLDYAPADRVVLGDIPYLDVNIKTGEHSKNASSYQNELKERIQRAIRSFKNAGEPRGSVIIFDELSKGTSDDEGSIVIAALERYFASRGAKLVYTTHFSTIYDIHQRLEADSAPVTNYLSVDLYSEDHLYQLLQGRGQSCGIRRAADAGLPSEIIENANWFQANSGSQ